MSFIKDMNKYTRGVTMPGGYKHSLPDTIREIDRHWDGQFKTGDLDSQGKHKYWYHTSRPLSEMASKNVDVNTSMIKLIGIPKQSELSTWVMSRELKEWLTENGFDELLNDINEDYPKYGHIVVKVHKRVGKSLGVSMTPIENLRMDPSSKWLKFSSFVGELHRMTRAEILREKNWDKKEIERMFKLNKHSDYDVYEYYTMEEEGWKRTWFAWIIRPNASSGGSTFGIEANINSPENMSYPPIKLFEDEVNELPYRELKWSKVAGRWLGCGEMEYLKDNQRHDNESGYLQLKALYIKALQLFTTTDDSLGGNVIRETVPGQVIKTSGELKPVEGKTTDLSAFAADNARWDKNAAQKAFSSDPSAQGGKPNKQAIAWIQSNTASYYKKKQENLGIFLRELLMNDIIPSFRDDRKKKHLFTFVGSYADIDQFTKFIVDAKVNAAAYQYVKKTGFMPSQDERMKESQRIERVLRSRNNHGLEIPNSFYENLVARIEIVITGENKDLQGLTPILTQILTLVGSNPAVLQNKATRSIVFKLLEFGGMQPAELDVLEQQMTQQANAPQSGQPGAVSGQNGNSQDPNAMMSPGASMPKPANQNNAPTMMAGAGSKQL